MPMPEEQLAIIRQYLHNSPFQEVQIAVCGLKGVGKGSLLRRHCQNFFSEIRVYDPSEDGLWRKLISMHDRPVIVQWATHLGEPLTVDRQIEPATQPAAQHQPLLEENAHILSRRESMVQQLVQGCEGCVFVYDVSNRASFERLADIHKIVRCVLTVPASMAPKPVMVVANKTDLPKTTWAVAKAEGNEFAERIGATFVETSAKWDSGVDEMVVEIVNGVLLSRITAQSK